MDTLYGVFALPPLALRRWMENFQKRHEVASYGEPHLNLRSPFVWRDSEDALVRAVESRLEQTGPLEVRLGDWERFSSAVYIGVEKTPELEQLHQSLLTLPGAPASSFDGTGYQPHLTIALGICPWAYRRIWREIHSEDIPVARWTASELVIAKDAGGELEHIAHLELGRVLALR